VFATVLIGAVLAMRFVIRSRRGPEQQPGLPVPAQGWLEAIKSAEGKFDASKPRIMLAARGRSNAEYAVDLARQRGAVLFAMYVRTLRVIDVRPDQVPRVENDPEGQEALGTAAVLAKEAGVPFVPIYVTATDIAGEILDYTVTYGCDRLILGKSKRSLFSRRVAGDVVRQITEQLPEGITLITRSGDRPYEPGTAREQSETGTDKRSS
jgi:nucleotide-binding universal stress UspA family protein